MDCTNDKDSTENFYLEDVSTMRRLVVPPPTNLSAASQNGQHSPSVDSLPPSLPPRAGSNTCKDRIIRSHNVTAFDPSFSIPGDGNLYGLSTSNMTQFFRCMGLDDRIVLYLRKKRVDGRSFGKLTDSELDEFNISNPVIMYFRDRSKKKKNTFML